MAIPDYLSFMLPMLRLAADGKDHTIREALDVSARHFGLTQEDLQKRLPSGTQGVVYNRVGWARTYLSKAGMLEIPKSVIRQF